MAYIIALLLMIAGCGLVVFLMKYFTNTKLTNLVFVLATFLCYLALVLSIYRKVGANDWNFRNTLPVANVSPFMFCTVPLALVLPERVRQWFRRLITLLSVGMFFAPVFSCIYFASIHYAFHPFFLLDYFAHFSLFLWGIYLVRSEQVTLCVREDVIGGSIIVAVALIMLILNVILDTAFFGLSLNGKHNIYNMVLVPYSALSAVIYFFGLIGVLFIGYFFRKIRIGKEDRGHDSLSA